MSLSPFKSAGSSSPGNSRTGNSRSDGSGSEPLSLSQALLITAGLAGLVGLFCGVVIRFSLSNSSKARFLSPLQTFPALSDWAPELPQGTADSHYLPGGVEAPKKLNRDFNREPNRDLNGSQRQFDSFAEQESTTDNSYRREDPTRTEERAPNDSYLEESYSEESYAEESYQEDTYSEDRYIEDGDTEAPYAEESYPEEAYSEEPYSEESYSEESYADEPYVEPYPEAEAPTEEAPYYEGDF